MYIYAKVRAIKDGDWYKKGDDIHVTWWGFGQDLIEEDDYLYGDLIKTIPQDAVEYIIKPDI